MTTMTAAAAATAPNEVTEMATETTALSPRFYTTDVKAMNELSVEAVRAEWDKLMAEFAADKNFGHFKRTDDWAFDPNDLPEDLRKELTDFMVSSLTAEFSGCVLYAELHKKGFDPDMKTLFKFLARDESRHAGFINECLRDFGVQVDMGFLVREKKYTHFSPKFILYATYLSEKIGYARYIRIYRHLEQNPDHQFHPIFQKFFRWCNDEFRHGEALALILRANPKLLRGHNRMWIRFFQLAVFTTMYVRDHTRPAFHRALGIDPEEYGMDVFRITAEISKQVFPDILDVDNPKFLAGLRKIHELALRIDASKKKGFFGKLRAIPLQLGVGVRFLKLLFLPTQANALPEEIRVAPAW